MSHSRPTRSKPTWWENPVENISHRLVEMVNRFKEDDIAHNRPLGDRLESQRSENVNKRAAKGSTLPSKDKAG